MPNATQRKSTVSEGLALALFVVAFMTVAQLPAANFVVRMQGTRFVPRDITITVGDSITWTNLDFTGHDSVSGTNGTPSGFWRTPLPPLPLLGFGGSATVTFTNFTPRSYGYYCTPHVFVGMVGSVTVLPANTPPEVTILEPADGALVPAGVPLTIRADPQDPDGGRIVRVDFFVDGSLLSSDSSGPFTATYANPTIGDHTLSVLAVDNRGGTSAPVSVTITAIAPPVIDVQPTDLRRIVGESATFSVVASGAPPLSYQWQFNGTNLVGETQTTLLKTNLTLSDDGIYTVVVSNPAASVTSQPARLEVGNNQTPVVTITAPADGTRSPAGAVVEFTADAVDPDGSIESVELFVNNVSVGDFAAGEPWRVVLTNLSVGRHTLRAEATDNLGRTGSSTPIVVSVHAPPGPVILEPADGISFPQLTGVAVTVSNHSELVTNVEVFANNFILGRIALSPSTNPTVIFPAWTPTELGQFELQARASDALGQRGTSAIVTVVFYEPTDRTSPTLSLAGSPPNFKKFTGTNTLWLSGQAGDDVGLSHIEAFQTGQFTGGTNLLTGSLSNWYALPNFLPGTRATNWQAAIPLPPGQSTIQVRSVDLATNYSRVQTRYYTFVVKTGILALAASPMDGGTNTPGSRTNLEIGALYRLEAKPFPNFIFAGWSNHVSGGLWPQATFNLVMSAYEDWTAYFVPDRWPKRAGDYSGLVTNQISTARVGNGLLTLKLTKSGQFTGKLKADGESYSPQGYFDAQDVAQTAIIRPGRKPIALTLIFTNEADGEFIQATVVGDDWNSEAQCYWNPFASRTNNAPQAGVSYFTNAVPNLIVAANVSTRGKVKLSGLLGDETKLTGASTINRDGLIPFYFTPANGDALLGWLNLGPGSSTALPSVGQYIPTGTNDLVTIQIIPQ